jgi:hypothetical protein
MRAEMRGEHSGAWSQPTKRNTLPDSGFMRDLRTGIAQLEREESLTVKQVFGEAYWLMPRFVPTKRNTLTDSGVHARPPHGNCPA